MSEFNTPWLGQMRAALDEAVLSDRGRRVAQKAVDQLEAEWYVRHREAYEDGVAARDKEHDVVMAAAAQFLDLVKAAAHDVRKGRRDADDVRRWLRDVYADFQGLTEAHQGVSASDDRLDAFVSLSPAEFQAEQFGRFAQLARSAPTLSQLMGEAARPRAGSGGQLSREQIDREQQVLEDVEPGLRDKIETRRRAAAESHARR